MNRGRGRKYNGKFNKSKEHFKNKKEKRKAKNDKLEFVNKKALFNRYKDKQRVEEEMEKKRKFEHKFQEQFESSESDEEDTYQQLLSTFGSKRRKVETLNTESEDSDESVDEEQEEILPGEELEDASDDEDVEGEDKDENSEEEGSDVIGLEEEESDVEGLEEEIDQVSDEELNSHEDNISEVRKNGNSKNASSLKILHSELQVEESIEENEIDIEAEKEDTTEESRDPFTRHFRDELSDRLYASISSVPVIMETSKKEWPVLGNLIINIPKCEQESKPEVKTKKMSILEERSYAQPGKVPERIVDVDYKALLIKSQIHGHIEAANKTNLIKNDLEITDKFTPLQKELFSIFNNYQDLYYPERSFTNAEEIRFTYCLHAINHVLKTRTKILHHNAKLSKKSEVPDEFRDQGMVRPKVLIIVPFRDAAYRIVKNIIEILTPKEAGQVMNKTRLDSDFTGGELLMPKRNPKPEDYELLFSGNSDDTFRLGMSITKKTLKLYTDFYSADIIIASPLGLRVIVGADGEDDRDYDFLASIEVLIMDQTDVFLMQNWDHLLHIMDHFHLQLKETHGTDFSRLRFWAANGWTKYYRQSLIFSSVALPEISSLFNKKCHNYAGKVRVVNAVQQGSIRHVAVQVPQVFHRISASSPLLALESRFNFFVKEVLPAHRDTLMAHTLIYVPSYFDYVKIRNYFKKEDISFVQICEYSKDGKVARARDMFFHDEAHFLLYSERVHFFRRLRIKGIRHIIFYQPPTYPHFYSEMCNLMQEANQNKYGGSACNMSVTVVYSKYDLQAVAAMVGSERAHKMAVAEQNVHMFMTGE